MHYDIAAKVLMEKCRGEILRRLVGLSVSEGSLLEELPQETVSLKRSDFPVLVTDEMGSQWLVLVEIRSRWDRQIPLRLLDYRSRDLLKPSVAAVSYALLLYRLTRSDNTMYLLDIKGRLVIIASRAART